MKVLVVVAALFHILLYFDNWQVKVESPTLYKQDLYWTVTLLHTLAFTINL